MNPNLAKVQNCYKKCQTLIWFSIIFRNLNCKLKKKTWREPHQIKFGCKLSSSKLYFYCLYRLSSFVLLVLALVYSTYISEGTESLQLMLSSAVKLHSRRRYLTNRWNLDRNVAQEFTSEQDRLRVNPLQENTHTGWVHFTCKTIRYELITVWSCMYIYPGLLQRSGWTNSINSKKHLQKLISLFH